LFLFASNLRHPSSFSFRNPFAKVDPLQPMFIVMFAVCSILPACGLSKVFKSVIRFVTVDMINYFCGHRASDIKPDKPMSRIKFPINFKIDVSFAMQASRLRPNFNFWTRFVPVQIARTGVIKKDGCECCVIKHAHMLPGFVLNCKQN